MTVYKDEEAPRSLWKQEKRVSYLHCYLGVRLFEERYTGTCYLFLVMIDRDRVVARPWKREKFPALLRELSDALIGVACAREYPPYRNYLFGPLALFMTATIPRPRADFMEMRVLPLFSGLHRLPSSYLLLSERALVIAWSMLP